MSYKPVDTAIVMVVGPCIDDTDFKSLEEAIAYNAAGMDISLIVEKTDGTSAVTAITLTTAGTSDWTHKDGGYYEVEITAAQNAEEGIAYLRGVCTGVLPFESPRYDIVKANIYDSLIKGTDLLQTDLTQIGGAAQSATDLKDFVDEGYDPETNKVQGVVLTDTCTTNTDMNELQTDWANGGRLDLLLDRILAATEITQSAVNDPGAAATTTKFITDLTSTSNDFWNRGAILFTSGNDAGQMRRIKDYNGTTKEITVQTAFDQIPANDDTFIIVAARAFLTVDIEDIADAVLDELTADHTGAGSLSKALIDVLEDTGTTIPADLLTMKQTAAGAYDRDTDSLEAIRNRGDAAWSAAAGTPSVLIDTTIAAVTDQTHFTLTAGSDIDDAYKDQAIVVYDASNSDYPSIRKVSAYTGATKTVTLDSAPDFTIIAGDGSKIFVTAPGTTAPTANQVADQVWDEAKVDHPDPTTFGGQNSFVNG